MLVAKIFPMWAREMSFMGHIIETPVVDTLTKTKEERITQTFG